MSLLKLQIEEHQETIHRLSASIDDHKKAIEKLKLEEAIANPPAPMSGRVLLEILEIQCTHSSGIIMGQCRFSWLEGSYLIAKVNLTSFFKQGYDFTPLYSRFRVDYTLTPILKEDIHQIFMEEVEG